MQITDNNNKIIVFGTLFKDDASGDLTAIQYTRQLIAYCREQGVQLCTFGELDPKTAKLHEALGDIIPKIENGQCVSLECVSLDYSPFNGFGADNAPLGPLEVLHLYKSKQLEAAPGEGILCPGYSVEMPNDGRRGAFSFAVDKIKGDLYLMLLSLEDCLLDGDMCAVYCPGGAPA